ncbi:uncharacterized protein LOC122320912 [Drosophila ficusphila]|uniref:uncharacterized protein LOC122320912 n=1 Tax=Drosophila ficusphila TaxID=30025 RepID=UPI001C895499|nr:uncharacterized protein LOC122320912 [Drosophila ficusphila]
MSEPPLKIRRIDFAELNQSSGSQQKNFIEEQNAALHRKVDILAEKLAKTTALFKVKLKEEEKSDQTGVPFPLKTEYDIELFESSMTPELREFYKAKITNVTTKYSFTKAIRYVLDDDLVTSHNLDGTSGKKSLKRFSNLYSIFIEVSEKAFPLEEANKNLRKSIHNIKNSII